jgi:copper(I)-binding protein
MTPKAIAVYMMIHNHGFGSDCLVGVDVEAPFKAKAEIHQTVVEGGVASMKPVDRICVAGRSEISLEPGGYHIMIMGNLTEDIKELTIVLHFQKSGDIKVRVPISSQQETHTH